MVSLREHKIQRPVLLLDGYCNLCSGSVVFILKRERKDVFHFASLQSQAAQNLLTTLQISDPPDSIVLIEGGEVFYKSAAALRVARRLKFPWPLLYGLMIVPRFFRDWLYDVIAKNRYKWFGKRRACYMPQKETRHKFLDAQE